MSASRKARTTWGLAAAALLAGAVAFNATTSNEPDADLTTASPAPAAFVNDVELQSMLEVMPVAAGGDIPGYERDCGPGEGCVFGQAWSDDVSVAGGHNGCDTRNDVLAQQLTDVQYKPGTNNCVVLTGNLDDRYTGERVPFDREQASKIQIDHVVPLHYAWQHGAADWDTNRRQDFANDPINLVATNQSSNSSKGDQGPSEWMPDTAQCDYAKSFASVISSYGLSVTEADKNAMVSACAA